MTAVPAGVIGIQNAARWERKPTQIRFVFAGMAFYAPQFPAVVLSVPFTHATLDPSAPPPPPQPFPEGVEAARIYSCPLEPTLRSITLLPGIIRYVVAQYRHLYVDMAGSFEDYLQRFSSKTRWTLRKKLKRFMETAGSHAYREYSQPSEMRDYHSLARAISAKTYQYRLLDAGIPEHDDFAVELERLAAYGAVRGYILFQGGIPASYTLCYAYGDTLTLDKTGFDPQFARLHPGTTLTYLMLQRLFEERRFRVFDFGSGDFKYKEFFSTGSVRCADLMYLRSTPRNLALILAHRGLRILSSALKGLLDMFGMKARVRKLVHRGW
jgi:hypothetical protein